MYGRRTEFHRQQANGTIDPTRSAAYSRGTSKLPHHFPRYQGSQYATHDYAEHHAQPLRTRGVPIFTAVPPRPTHLSTLQHDRGRRRRLARRRARRSRHLITIAFARGGCLQRRRLSTTGHLLTPQRHTRGSKPQRRQVTVAAVRDGHDAKPALFHTQQILLYACDSLAGKRQARGKVAGHIYEVLNSDTTSFIKNAAFPNITKNLLPSCRLHTELEPETRRKQTSRSMIVLPIDHTQGVSLFDCRHPPLISESTTARSVIDQHAPLPAASFSVSLFVQVSSHRAGVLRRRHTPPASLKSPPHHSGGTAEHSSHRGCGGFPWWSLRYYRQNLAGCVVPWDRSPWSALGGARDARTSGGVATRLPYIFSAQATDKNSLSTATNQLQGSF